MKKNTLIALFAILTLTLGGCSEKAEPAADTTTTAETTIEQTITDEETAKQTTEEITEEVTTEETTTAAPETTTEEVTTTEEITTTEEVTTTPETTPIETTTEEIVTEEVTKAPETTTQPAPETTPVQEEAGLSVIEYPTQNYAYINENKVEIYPAAAWYEGEKFSMKCIVTNGFNVDKVVTSVPKFIVNDANGDVLADAKFDAMSVTVPAGGYVIHTFTFKGAALMNANADYSNITWSITTNFSDVSAPITSLASASQTVMGGRVKVTAEKKSNNTIVLTIENNFEKEVSTFGYPQIKVNGMTQDLDKHLQLQNGTQNLSVPAGEKGQITYYVNDINSVEALIGSLHSMAPSVKDKDFKLVF